MNEAFLASVKTGTLTGGFIIRLAGFASTFDFALIDGLGRWITSTLEDVMVDGVVSIAAGGLVDGWLVAWLASGFASMT